MNLSENELFQILYQRYQEMQSSKSNVGRNFMAVEEALEAFTSSFNNNNSTHTFQGFKNEQK